MKSTSLLFALLSLLPLGMLGQNAPYSQEYQNLLKYWQYRDRLRFAGGLLG